MPTLKLLDSVKFLSLINIISYDMQFMNEVVKLHWAANHILQTAHIISNQYIIQYM